MGKGTCHSGKTKESSGHVTFVRNSGNTAVYRVTGTTLNFKIVEVKQELVTVARFGEEIRSTHLQKYYRSEVTFQEGGNQYLFHQSNQDNRWYMAKLSRDWDLQQEIKSGNYQRFYEVLVPFRFNGKNYLFAHSKQDHRWFISELSTSWDGQSEIGNGCWDNYYGCVFIFEQDGKVYLCAHSESDKRFFMTEILIGYETK